MTTQAKNGHGKGQKNRLAESLDALTPGGPDAPKGAKTTTMTISPPKFRTVAFTVEGTAPLMQARFSAKAMNMMKSKMLEGSTAKKGKNRAARDFDDDFQQAMHVSSQGWVGVPAAAFRNACIDVCRMVGFKMTHAKMSIFVEADGLDQVDGTPLVRLIADEPERTEMPVRNATGVVDIRVRPMWREWSLNVRIRFDEDQFKLADVLNLLARAGMQVGIGEGRAFSRESNGTGCGFFRVSTADGE
jgi:hypothetical protein